MSQITFTNPGSYKTEKKPATLINLAYMMFLLFGAIILLQSYESNAMNAKNTIQICERNFIGTEYKPQLKNKCDLIWLKLTYEITSSYAKTR